MSHLNTFSDKIGLDDKNIVLPPVGNPVSFYPKLPEISWQLSTPSQTKVQTDRQTSKFKKIWSTKEIRKIYEIASNLCSALGKDLNELGYHDHKYLANVMGKTMEQVYKKLLEIHTSGTLTPGIWNPLEDARLIELVSVKNQKWLFIASTLNNEIHKGYPLRSGKQCKERWNNYLNPNLKRDPWTDEDDVQILELFVKYGESWAKIAKACQVRTQISLKNRIKSLLNKERKNLKSQNSALPLVALNAIERIKEKLASYKASSSL